MLTFKELRITPTGKNLIIDVSVDPENYYDDVFIDSIVIDTQNTYVPNGPSSNPIYTYIVDKESVDKTYSTPEECNCSPVKTEEDYSYCFTYSDSQRKRVRLILTSLEIGNDINNTMFFVYAIATGTPSPDTPCGFDNSKKLGVVTNLYPYYQSMMNYVKEIESTCTIPKNFIDSSLKLKALELCIRTGNYPQAIKYWNKFFNGKMNRPIVTNCSCYG